MRSTPEWQSHDLAESISRPGTNVPWSRAKNPTAYDGSVASQGQRSRPGGQLGRRRLVVERRQRFAGLDLAGGDQLRDGKRPDPPRFFRRINVGDRRVGRAQVESDDVAAGGWE